VAPPDAKKLTQNIIGQSGQSVVIGHHSLPTYRGVVNVGQYRLRTIETTVIFTILHCAFIDSRCAMAQNHSTNLQYALIRHLNTKMLSFSKQLTQLREFVPPAGAPGRYHCQIQQLMDLITGK